MYIRVKDPDTGHEFDVREDSFLLSRGLVKQVKPTQYPPAHQRRRTKHYLNLSARQDTGGEHPEEETNG